MKMNSNLRYAIILNIICTLIIAFSRNSLSAVSKSTQSSHQVTVEGKSLKKIGSGVREFLFFDIYRMDAYSESGPCDAKSIVYIDETKYLRLTLIREISQSRMTSTLRETFEDNLPPKPSKELKANIEKFLSYFKSDLTENSIVEIFYTPGKGTVVKQNNRRLGPPVPGKDFAEMLWRSYFGEETCCKGLKSSILEQCATRH